MSDVICIAGQIQKLKKKDILIQAINDLTKDQVNTFSSLLKPLEKNYDKIQKGIQKESSDKGRVSSKQNSRDILKMELSRLSDLNEKMSDEGIITLAIDFSKLQIISSKIDEVKNYDDTIKILEQVKQFEELASSIVNLIKFLRGKTYKKIVDSEIMKKEDLAKKEELPVRQINRFLSFYDLISQFPLLLHSKFSFTNLVNYKKKIEELANEDPNLFLTLQSKPEFSFFKGEFSF